MILRGQLTIAYPQGKGKDSRVEQQMTTVDKATYGVGERIDVDAGRVHEVWIGGEGCTYVIGE